jgi:hypothetical protein
MIAHVVCFRFKPGTTTGQVDGVRDALLGMRGRIAEIRDIHFGPNLAPGATEYSHALVVTLDDMEAVNRYAVHPVHVQVVTEVIAPLREARLAIDVEV